MPVLTGHGGGCCGARHIHGFSDAENINPNLIDTVVATVPNMRMSEVILNGTQCAGYPNILNRLADLGYVLVGHYINGNHMSHNYVFHRCDRRLPLTNLPFAWPGQIMTPGLTGDLPNVAVIAPQAANRAINPGDRVRVNSPTSTRHRMEFTVTGVIYDDYRGSWYVNMVDAAGVAFRIVRHNCIKIQPAQPPQPLVRIPHRHTQPDARQMGLIQDPAPPTVIISFYHNVYRHGRSEIAHATYADARTARGNPLRVDRHDLMTNGEFLWVEGVVE
jgi:hypothetical protein